MHRLLPPILFVTAAAAMVAIYRKAPVADMLPEPLNYVAGIPLILLGLGLTLHASQRFRRIGTNINTFRRPDILVQDGVFSFTWNPRYLGFSIALLGFSLKLNAAPNLAVVAGFVLVTDLWYIRYEEWMAAQTFGEEYELYRRRTRRWI